MPVRKIRLRRGNQTNLPTLDAGEPGFALDTKRLYVGGSDGNVEIATKEYVDGEITAVEAEIPSIEGLATETYVDNAIAEVETGGSGPVQPYLELTNETLIVLPGELGTPVSFTRSEETPSDAIDEGLTLARGSNGGLYNSEIEESYDNSNHDSPEGTLWNNDGWGDLSDVNSRQYVTMRESLNNQIGNNIIGAELIMWDTINDKYYKFSFSDWGQNNGGSFAYTRTLITNPNFFKKTDYGSEVDEISEGLHITRGNNQGIYNPLEEEGWSDNTSPVNSVWNFDGWDDLSDIETRTYSNLFDAFNNGLGNLPGAEAVMRDTTTDKYWAIQFLSWTQNNQGGGFSYVRYEIDTTKLNEGVRFADGSVIKSAEGLGRVKSTASRGRRIEEVVGSKTVSVTESIDTDYQSTSTRTTTTNFEIFVSRTSGDDLDIAIDSYWNGNAELAFSISFDNVTFQEVWLSSVQTSEYWFYYQNIPGYVPQTQGDTVYIRITSGGDPVTWWDKNDLPGGSGDFRGAIIDYHAYVVNEGTIIGTIHIADDNGDEHITHTETSSGSNDLDKSDLWYVTTEGRIRFRQLDGQPKTMKVHWTAKVFYGEEFYD